jgi:hypothetical protein
MRNEIETNDFYRVLRWYVSVFDSSFFLLSSESKSFSAKCLYFFRTQTSWHTWIQTQKDFVFNCEWKWSKSLFKNNHHVFKSIFRFIKLERNNLNAIILCAVQTNISQLLCNSEFSYFPFTAHCSLPILIRKCKVIYFISWLSKCVVMLPMSIISISLSSKYVVMWLIMKVAS